MQAQLATLAGAAEFLPWQRPDPQFKPRLSGFLATATGVRHVTVLLDTGASHGFICARLAAELGLPPSGQPGPRSVTTAATVGQQGLTPPVLIYLGLGDVLRESLSISPMDMDVGADLILGWDWISSHDLHHLYADGQVRFRSGSALLQLDLLPAAARPATRTLAVIGHGEFRRLLRQLAHEPPAEVESADRLPVPTTLPPPPPPGTSKGWSSVSSALLISGKLVIIRRTLIMTNY